MQSKLYMAFSNVGFSQTVFLTWINFVTVQHSEILALNCTRSGTFPLEYFLVVVEVSDLELPSVQGRIEVTNVRACQRLFLVKIIFLGASAPNFRSTGLRPSLRFVYPYSQFI